MQTEKQVMLQVFKSKIFKYTQIRPIEFIRHS